MSTDRDGPDVDGYLSEVCYLMGGSFAEQQTVRDELRAHLRDAARDGVMSGLTPADALSSALRDLGPAADLGKAMRSSRGTRPLKRPLMQPAGALRLRSQSDRHLPQLRLVIALAALVAMPAVVAVAYAWPG
jgi:hypothetical protein